MSDTGLDWDEEDYDDAPLVAVPGPLFDFSYRHYFPKHSLDLYGAAHAFAEGGSAGSLFTRESAPLLGLLCVYSFFAAGLISVPSSFFPQELVASGASSTFIGVIFAAYPMTNLLVSPASSWVCQRVGRRTVLVAGLFVESLAACLMGFVPRERSTVSVFILLRILQGVGAAGSYTALLAYVAERFPQKLGMIMGLQEAVAGLGFMVGPPVGGILYTSGGFALPFVFMGLGLLVGIPIVPFAAPRHTEAPRAPPPFDVAQPNGGVSDWQLIKRVLRIPSVFNAVACTVVTGIGFGFILPTLSPHLHETLHVSEKAIGGLLSMCACLYALTAPFAGALSDRIGPKYVMAIGDVIMGIAYLLIGPSPIFTGGENPVGAGMWATQIFALCFIGVGAALAFIPCMPDMERNVHGLGPQSTELVAGLYNGVFCAGEALGPLIGGVLVSLMNFAWATTIIAGSLWLYVVVLAVVAARMKGHLGGGGGGAGGWLRARLAGTPAGVAAAARKAEDGASQWVPLLPEGGGGGASGSRGGGRGGGGLLDADDDE